MVVSMSLTRGLSLFGYQDTQDEDAWLTEPEKREKGKEKKKRSAEHIGERKEEKYRKS